MMRSLEARNGSKGPSVHQSWQAVRTAHVWATLILAAAAGPVAAQEGWSTEVTSYLWFPSTASTVQSPFGPVETELSARDAIADLDFGFMGTTVSRRGPFALTGDIVYLDMTSEDPTPFGTLFSEAVTETKLTVISVYGSYEVASGPTFGVEVGAGLRGVSSSIDVTLSPGALPETTVEIDDAWVDPVVAARATGRLGERWIGALTVDYGGFGIGNASDSTWQAIATVGYRINERWSVQGGYRQLYFDQEDNGVDYEVDLSGPILGATYRY